MKPGTQVLCVNHRDRRKLLAGKTFTVTESYFSAHDGLPIIHVSGDDEGYYKSRFISLPDEIDLRDGK